MVAEEHDTSRFRAIFESASDAIFLMDGETFSDCNRATLQMFRCAADEILGQPPYRFSPPQQADGSDSVARAKALVAAALGGEPQFFEWRHTRADGTPFDAEVSLNRIEYGGRVRIQAIVRDVSERKRAEQRMRELNEELELRVRERTRELERTNKDLESFAYSVSHELRGPIARLRGYSEAIIESLASGDTESISHFAARIEVASQRLRTVVDSLLHLNRLARSGLAPSAVDLTALATEVWAALTETAAHAPAFDVAPDLNAVGDPDMLRVLLQNLLGNALKYTARTDRATVTVAKERRGGCTVFFVRDNGAGFDMAHAQRLFQPFVRLHKESDFEGTGIGLATAQRIVERHGGRIWADATPSGGATFFFTLTAE